MSVNKVILVGNLGRDPEIRYTQSGSAVANFTMATSERWTDSQSGEKREKTEWHRIVAFRKLAEICGEYLRKGRQVYIEGSLQTREWTDRDGNKKYTTEIVAQNMQMLGSRADRDRDGDGGGGGGGTTRSSGDSGGDSGGDDDPGYGDDDVPF